jgi:hypothetical protein
MNNADFVGGWESAASMAGLGRSVDAVSKAADGVQAFGAPPAWVRGMRAYTDAASGLVKSAKRACIAAGLSEPMTIYLVERAGGRRAG